MTLDRSALTSYIFDVDGTLLKTSELIYRTFVHVMEPHGLTINKAQLIPLIGLPLRKVFENYLGEIPDSLEQEMAEKVREFQKNHFIDLVEPFSFVAEDLEALKTHGHPLAIVTSRRHETLALMLKHFKLQDYFSAIVTPHLTQSHKPHPEPLELALSLLAANASEAIYIGDAAVDLACAKAAGTQSALVAWTENNWQDFEQQPDYFLSRLLDLRTVKELE